MTRILRKTIAMIAMAFIPGSAVAQDISGLWRTPANAQGHLEIEFQNCGAALCGTIVRARNPEGETALYEHVGKRMIWDMMPADEAASWNGGKIWDPRNGRTFNSRMTLRDNQLDVAGCVLGICQSQTWLRLR